MANKQSMPSCYTTDISYDDSLSDIRTELREYGVTDFSENYEFDPDVGDDGEQVPTAIRFTLDVEDMGRVPIERQPKIEAIEERLDTNQKKQAYNVAWRREYYYIEMIIDMVKDGYQDIIEGFLPDIVISKDGQTARMAEVFRQQSEGLPSGRPVEFSLESGS